MFLKLFILFAIIPVTEIAILIKVGSIIGALYTVMIVLGTAVIGAYLVRLEGLNIMTRFQRNIAEGRFPAEEIFDGALVLVAGAVLLTPGLVTDLLGFILVFPPTRKPVKAMIKRYFESRIQTANIHRGPGGPFSDGGPFVDGGGGSTTRPSPKEEDENVIDAEWH